MPQNVCCLTHDVARSLAAPPPHASPLPRSVGRPSKVAGFADDMRAWLRDEPRVSGAAVLTRLRERGYAGGRSAALEQLRQLRMGSAELPALLATPGMSAEHFVCSPWVRFDTGWKRRLFVFSRLSHSGWLTASAASSNSAEAAIRTVYKHFERAGGLPVVVRLHLDTAAQNELARWPDGWPDLLETFVVDHGLAQHPWPDRARAATRATRVLRTALQTALLRSHAFRSEDELAHSTERWMNQEFHDGTVVACAQARAAAEHERAHLRPLTRPSTRLTLRTWRPIEDDGSIPLADRRYQTPPDCPGRLADVRLTAARVFVRVGTRTASWGRRIS